MKEFFFIRVVEEFRKYINIWVLKKIEGKIEELLLGSLIDVEIRLVFVNVIYFKGKWNELFDEIYIREMFFKIN